MATATTPFASDTAGPEENDVLLAAAALRYARSHRVGLVTLDRLLASGWAPLVAHLRATKSKADRLPLLQAWLAGNVARGTPGAETMEAAMKAAEPLVLKEPDEPESEIPARPSTVHDLHLESMASLKPTPIEWLAPGRLPLGKLVVIAGVGGLGKSSVTLDLAARLSRGEPMFGMAMDDPADVAGPSDILLLAAEDDPADTQLPRLIAAGADITRIRSIKGIAGPNGKTLPFSLSHIDELSKCLKANPSVRLVVIDPVACYVGRAKVDDHKNVELTSLLSPLAELAAEHAVTMLLVCHLNKSSGSSAVNRIMGGSAYVNSTRATFIVFPSPDDPDVRVLDAVKFNIGPKPKPLAFHIRELEPDEITEAMDHPSFADLEERQRTRMARQLARVEWQGECEITADEGLSSGTGKRGAPPVDKAEVKAWLHRHLAEHGPTTKELVLQAAKGLYGEKAIWTAWQELREQFHVKPYPQEDNGKRYWLWPRLQALAVVTE